MADELTTSKYHAGKFAYHLRKDCAGENETYREQVSLIEALRQHLVPCQKCNPPELPDEYAECVDCGWQANVADLERERGYKGPCPECNSPQTTSQFKHPTTA